MYTLSDYLEAYMDATKDDSSENQKRGIRMINQYYDEICAGGDYYWLQKDYTVNTVASQQNYNLPKNMRKVIDVYVVAAGITYTATEITDYEKWDRLQRYTQVISDTVTHYHIRNNDLYLYPTPSSNNNVIHINGLRSIERELKLLDWNTGTIAVTNASAVVTGTSTSWGSSVAKAGSWIEINDVGYEILTVDSATQVTLVEPYQGTTASGLKYRIGDVSIIPREFRKILWLGAAKDYFRDSKDSETRANFTQDFLDIEKRLRSSTYSKTTSNVQPRSDRRPANINDFPINLTQLPL